MINRNEFVNSIKESYQPSVRAKNAVDKVMIEMEAFFSLIREDLIDEINAYDRLDVSIDYGEFKIDVEHVGLKISRRLNYIIIESRCSNSYKNLDELVYENGKVVNIDGEEFSTQLLEKYLGLVFEKVTG